MSYALKLINTLNILSESYKLHKTQRNESMQSDTMFDQMVDNGDIFVVFGDSYSNQPAAFVDKFYIELDKQGLGKQADTILNAADDYDMSSPTLQDDADIAWENILDNFIYKDKYFIDYGPYDDNLYAFPIKATIFRNTTSA